MSEENGGFVERPFVKPRVRGLSAQLKATVTNGMAIAGPTRERFTGAVTNLKGQGYRVHTAKQPDGTFLAWCERIEKVEAQP